LIDSFQTSLALLLDTEDGFVDNPKDPGGATNLGVTKRAWAAFTKRDLREVTTEEIRSLTPEQVAPLYRSMFWNVCMCDLLPEGIDYAVFDFAVNSGPQSAVKTLQEAAGTRADGRMGPLTLHVIDAITPNSLLYDYATARKARLKTIVGYETFGHGWTNRVNEVLRNALAMI